MAIDIYDMVIYKGTDFEVTFEFDDSAGVDLDLEDDTLNCELRATPGAASVTAEFVLDKTDADEGKIVVSLANGVTSSLGEGKYYWDFARTDAVTDKISVLLSGRATVIGIVSRDWS